MIFNMQFGLFLYFDYKKKILILFICLQNEITPIVSTTKETFHRTIEKF
jgi:hypothetical protein